MLKKSRHLCAMLIMLIAMPLWSHPRIIGIGGDVSEIIFALGQFDNMVARDTTSLYPAAVLKLPDVGYIRQLNIEGILALHPDIVVANDQAKPSLVLSQLAEQGVEVVVVPGQATIANIPDKISLIAQALHVVPQGQQLIDEFNQQMAQLSTKPSPVKVMAILNYSGTTPMTAGVGSAVDEMIRAAGAINSAQFKGLRPLSQEGIVAMNPDVVLITTMGLANLGGLDKLWQLPGLMHTPAGKNRKVIVIDDHALLNFGLQTPRALLQLQQNL